MEKLCLLFMLLISILTFPHQAEKVINKPELVIKMPSKVVKSSKITPITRYQTIVIERFKRVISRRESGGNYKAVSISGCLGKYQFLQSTLRTLSIDVTDSMFLADSLLQEVAMDKLVITNYKWLKHNGLLHYVGKDVGGVRINEYGMLAAMHLLGGASLQHYLLNRGSMEEFVMLTQSGRKIHIRKQDGLNTSIKDYLNLFNV